MNNTNKLTIDEINGRYGNYWIYTCSDGNGEYVDIYTDEERTDLYDYFYISPEQLETNPNHAYWIKEYLGLNEEA